MSKAAEQGHPDALCNLGYMIKQQAALIPQSQPSFIPFEPSQRHSFDRSTAIRANLIRSVKLTFGCGYSEAARLFRLAADRGSVAACFHLGDMHEKGLGVCRDIITAFYYYKAASDLGNDKHVSTKTMKFSMDISANEVIVS